MSYFLINFSKNEINVDTYGSMQIKSLTLPTGRENYFQNGEDFWTVRTENTYMQSEEVPLVRTQVLKLNEKGGIYKRE